MLKQPGEVGREERKSRGNGKGRGEGRLENPDKRGQGGARRQGKMHKKIPDENAAVFCRRFVTSRKRMRSVFLPKVRVGVFPLLKVR